MLDVRAISERLLAAVTRELGCLVRLQANQAISQSNSTRSGFSVAYSSWPRTIPRERDHVAPLLDDSVGDAHACLMFDLLALLAATTPARSDEPRDDLLEPLTESEARVLRYLPTNLSKQEIADHLYVSVHTVKTHIHHLYTKLDVHTRGEAVERARAFGLLRRAALRADAEHLGERSAARVNRRD